MPRPHDAGPALTAAAALVLAAASNGAGRLVAILAGRRPPPAAGNPSAPRADASRPAGQRRRGAGHAEAS